MKLHKRSLAGLVAAGALLFSACAIARPIRPLSGQPVVATARTSPLAAPTVCGDRFHPQSLEFAVETDTLAGSWFDTNGAGVAVGDLNGDQMLDIVLANLAGPPAILINRGGLRFERSLLEDYAQLRQPAIIDVDGDGLPDLAFTQRASPPLVLRNSGNGTFERMFLRNVYEPAYAMSWADVDLDGRLDLVAASYNAELSKANPNDFLFNRRGGVWVYRNLGDWRFEAVRLATDAQALALLVHDLNGDGRSDIWVGNDYDLPDQRWENTSAGWRELAQPPSTSHSTMGLTIGDIDNDGVHEIFASDMRPNSVDPNTWVDWLPTMQSIDHALPVGDPQVNENMLYVRGTDQIWRNQARGLGIDAAGWAWSAQFGDLDRDGRLDLYVVNGMVDRQLFKHLPHDALVEQNWVFRNTGGRFQPAPEWDLGDTASGRAMVLADLDNDGDLDAVVSNVLSPAVLMENRICSGAAIEVEIHQPGGNAAGWGAELQLSTSAGTYSRVLLSASGHLSSNAPRAHFGIPSGAKPTALTIKWPDGRVSETRDLGLNQLVTITR